jgi:hypothetical protein
MPLKQILNGHKRLACRYRVRPLSGGGRGLTVALRLDKVSRSLAAFGWVEGGWLLKIEIAARVSVFTGRKSSG